MDVIESNLEGEGEKGIGSWRGRSKARPSCSGVVERMYLRVIVIVGVIGCCVLEDNIVQLLLLGVELGWIVEA